MPNTTTATWTTNYPQEFLDEIIQDEWDSDDGILTPGAKWTPPKSWNMVVHYPPESGKTQILTVPYVYYEHEIKHWSKPQFDRFVYNLMEHGIKPWNDTVPRANEVDREEGCNCIDCAEAMEHEL